jgi:hypothetical protein
MKLEVFLRKFSFMRSLILGPLFWMLFSTPSFSIDSDLGPAVRVAINKRVRYLRKQLEEDRVISGHLELATLALLTAGEPPSSTAVSRALKKILETPPPVLTQQPIYSVALQIMVLVATGSSTYQKDPRYLGRIERNVNWLIDAQQPNGAWGYHKNSRSDNSCTLFALLGLDAARAAGVEIKPSVFQRALEYWLLVQHPDGSWGYIGKGPNSQYSRWPSMTAAGISSLAILGSHIEESLETLEGDEVKGCGKSSPSSALAKGIQALATTLSDPAVIQLPDQDSKNQRDLVCYLYFMYGLERAGRLTGQRYFGSFDWYRRGAEVLTQARRDDVPHVSDVINESFIVLFLAKGLSPVLVNKVEHEDGSNDPHDLSNLLSFVNENYKNAAMAAAKNPKVKVPRYVSSLVWQSVNLETATLEQMHQAPILYLTGHTFPNFSPEAKTKLKMYVQQGGYLFAEACCGSPQFDAGFKTLMNEIFGKEHRQLLPLPTTHEVYRGYHGDDKFKISPMVRPLYGIDYGCRTAIIYSPRDVSCFWNQLHRFPDNPLVDYSKRLGQNLIDYFTERTIHDKLRLTPSLQLEASTTEHKKEDVLAELSHGAGFKDAAGPLQKLGLFLKALPFPVNVNIRSAIVHADDWHTMRLFPFLYMQGSQAFVDFENNALKTLRTHLDRGGTLFANALGGSPQFDAAFRDLVRDLSGRELRPIPKTDEIYWDPLPLNQVKYNKGLKALKEIPDKEKGEGFPDLESVKIDGHHEIIYSKYDIGCAMDESLRDDKPGYESKSAKQISTNVMLYATKP